MITFILNRYTNIPTYANFIFIQEILGYLTDLEELWSSVLYQPNILG